ncbi:phospholipase A1 PLIP3, chloroplastic-like [Phragmites australis]|uniref:phospholipase A1 PLIP3, chloroplastic-like n=1 Tax=Phragmites australis TaxID=29695 RepID=UPI002D796689|nr:phospholipase A1 PLIP3, chloroplastic-like [Phragmites australis]
MDVLRFVRGVRPPAPAAVAPQPPAVTSVSAAPAPSPHVAATAAAAASPAPGFHSPLLRLWPRRGSVSEGEIDRGAAAEAASVEETRDRWRHGDVETEEGRDGNWVLQILRVQSWSMDDADRRGEDSAVADAGEADRGGERCVRCGTGADGDKGCAVGDTVEFDRAAFSRLLRKVSLAEAKLYSKMSYLCNFAYMVPRIKPKYLQKYNMKFVTSSVEERAKVPIPRDQKDQKLQDRKNLKTGIPSEDQESICVSTQSERKQENESGHRINPLAAYQVAASAASYLQSRAMGVLPFGSQSEARSVPTIQTIVNGEHAEGLTMDEASFVATTNSMTSMVAAKEETKQAVADDLNSSRSCPCEWFICDDNLNSARYFVVQGSETIASWQANLLFEPIKFEGLDVLVHRGIYEAAKGIYQQMLPYVKSHLRSHGKFSRLQFTGHSLGGSLALLVNLMLLMRGVAPAASLLPVITFGAPSIMCGGDYLLEKLGLPKSHVKSITMHRDIVPRVFSCHYPDHVASILKLVNGNFRSHPCLTNQKLLYAPMGEVLILQPDEKFSPHHHLLPPGSGLYLVGGQKMDSDTSSRVLQSALSAFFNSPHPLEILREGGAYGPKGTVYRDHDVHLYLRSVRAVLRKEMRTERERRRLLQWPIQVYGVVTNIDRRHVLRQLQRHAHLLVVFLLPAKLLFLGVLSVIRSH